MFFLIAACFGSAFVVSIVTTRLMRTLSPRWGLIDQPAGEESSRHAPLPWEAESESGRELLFPSLWLRQSSTG